MHIQDNKISLSKTRRLLHELRVHQIELEMQNEELRETQALLEVSRAQYIELYDFAPVGYFTVSEIGLILDANLAAAAMLGVNRGALAGQAFTRFILDEDQDIYYHYRNALFETGGHQTCRVRMRGPSGNVLWTRLEANIAQGANGTPNCRVVMIDITETCRAEAAFQERESLLRIAGHTAKFGGWGFDIANQRIVWSDEVADIHGKEPGYSPKRDEAINFYTPEWQEKIVKVFCACINEGEPYDEEMEIVTAHGKRVWVRTTGEAVRDESGKIVRVQGAFQDITERKRAEGQVRQLRKSEGLGRMAGAIAHHYNNQLAAVMLNLDLAMEKLPLDSGPVAALLEAMKAAHRASEMGGLMLDYLGQTIAPREPLDLSEACRTSLPDIQAGMPPYLTFKADLPHPGPAVFANADQIRKILCTLAINSREAMNNRPGSVLLKVRPAAPSDISSRHCFPIGFQPGGDGYACLEVTDRGCGIAEVDTEKLFDPFYSTKFVGRGLGLPVTLGIVKAHDGCITVESEPDRITVFRVYLPLTDKKILHLNESEKETASGIFKF